MLINDKAFEELLEKEIHDMSMKSFHSAWSDIENYPEKADEIFDAMAVEMGSERAVSFIYLMFERLVKEKKIAFRIMLREPDDADDDEAYDRAQLPLVQRYAYRQMEWLSYYPEGHKEIYVSIDPEGGELTNIQEILEREKS